MAENNDKGGELGKALVPGIGMGAALALIRVELPIWGLLIFLLTIAVLAVKNPAMFTAEGPEGAVQRTLSSADYTRSQLTARLIVPGAAMLASFTLEPTALDPVVTTPLTFLTTSAASTWAFLRVQTQTGHGRAGKGHLRDRHQIADRGGLDPTGTAGRPGATDHRCCRWHSGALLASQGGQRPRIG